MAEINKLIARMVERGVDQAILLNDRPSRLIRDGNEASGPTIPFANLQAIIREVTPPGLVHNLDQNTTFEFSHPSPHGLFHIFVVRNQNLLQATIKPALQPEVSPAANYAGGGAWQAAPPPIPPPTYAPPTNYAPPQGYGPPNGTPPPGYGQPPVPVAASVGCLPVLGLMVACMLGLILTSILISEYVPYLVVLGTSIWVGIDARIIGMRKGRLSGWADMGPWSWVAACLLLWMFGFPAYLVARTKIQELNAALR